MFLKYQVLLKPYTCLPMLRFHNNWQNLGNHPQSILAFQGIQNGRSEKTLCKQSLGRRQCWNQEKFKNYQFRSISSITGKNLDLLDELLLYWHALDSIKIDSTVNGGESSSSERLWSYYSYVPCGHVRRVNPSRVWLEVLALLSNVAPSGRLRRTIKTWTNI